MAKPYFEKLKLLVSDLNLENEADTVLEVKHLFSGAALYSDQVICASWSPAGLAFKLLNSEVTELISSGKAQPLKYFVKGHIKKGYAVFENPELSKQSKWKIYFLRSIKQTK